MPKLMEPPVEVKPVVDYARIVASWAGNRPLATGPVKFPPNFPGPRLVVWDRYSKIIQKFIADNGLVSVEDAAAHLKRVPEQKVLAAILLHWINPYGGGPGLHLHYEGKVYPVNEAQWNEFSKLALATMRQKLETASTVPFEEFITGASVIEEMAVRR